MSAMKPKGEPFLLFYSILLQLIVVGGFGINGWLNTEALPPISNLVITHGVIMLIWFMLVPLQAFLIRRSSYKLHIAFGITSLGIALGIIISGTMISVDNYQRTGDPSVLTVNLPILINFTILYSTAIYRRKYSDEHKRLILFSSIAMMAPALGRISRIVGVDEFLSIPMWLVLLIVPFVYDKQRLNRIHKSTWLGAVLIVLGILFAIVTLGSSTWSQFLEYMFGRG